MNERLRRKVRRRAKDRCEYCQMPQSLYRARFPIDHIIAEQHSGPTELPNLALACLRCNLNKGPNIASRDRRTGKMVRLFSPRRDRWSDHFRWDGPVLVGRTAIGRATVELLKINHRNYVEVRAALIYEGVFPPEP